MVAAIVSWVRRTVIGNIGLAIVGLLTVAAPPDVRGSNAVAPLFSLPGTSGVVSLDQFRGQLVYLDFWASWCGPCKRSFPFMNAIQRKYADRGLRVVAVNVDQSTDDARQFLRAVPADFTVAFDPLGVTPGLYKIKGMPSSVLIGRDGNILSFHQGFKPADEGKLERAIIDALDSGK